MFLSENLGKKNLKNFIRPTSIRIGPLIDNSTNRTTEINIQRDKRRSSVYLFNNFNNQKLKEENKMEYSDSYSSLDIQKAGINSKNARIVGGNKHSIVAIKNCSKFNVKKNNNNSKNQISE